MFEGSFVLFAHAKFAFGPAEVGYAFVVCGLVMSVFQAGAVGFLAGKISEMIQIGIGFAVMGTGITLLATAFVGNNSPGVFASVICRYLRPRLSGDKRRVC
jgi:DHA1 family multidrug resistance protein-like MFS transporter